MSAVIDPKTPQVPPTSGHLVPLAPLNLAPGIAILPLLQLQSDLEPYDTAAENVEGQCSRAEITTLESYQAGSDVLSAIQAQIKLLEVLRVATKKPADDYGSMVQKLVNPLKERFEKAKQLLSGKMLTWRNAEEARQRAAQEEIRKQQEKEAAELAAAARAQGNEKTAERIEEMVAAAPTAPAPKVSAPNFMGKTHAKRVYWLGDAQDPMEIIRQVAAGKLPIHVIEFSKSGMNAVATEFAKGLKQADIDSFDASTTIHLGIKITKSDKLV